MSNEDEWSCTKRAADALKEISCRGMRENGQGCLTCYKCNEYILDFPMGLLAKKKKAEAKSKLLICDTPEEAKKVSDELSPKTTFKAEMSYSSKKEMMQAIASSFQKEMVKLTIDEKVHSVNFMANKNTFLKKFACVIVLMPTYTAPQSVGKSENMGKDLKKNKPVTFTGTDFILENAFFIALEKYRSYNG